MATAKVSPLFSHVQFPSIDDVDEQGCSPYIALIQQSVRKWEKPWRHQRAIAFFACSPEEVKLRLLLEGRVRAGEYWLKIVQAGGQ